MAGALAAVHVQGHAGHEGRGFQIEDGAAGSATADGHAHSYAGLPAIPREPARPWIV
jgi:hypothetical protein